MAREATELVNYLEFDHRSTGKRKRAAVEQQQPVSVAAASLEPRACIERSENEISSKRAPAAAEKLWDGSLQLSSSVHVSAVAFFKRFIQSLLKFDSIMNVLLLTSILISVLAFHWPSFFVKISYLFALI